MKLSTAQTNELEVMFRFANIVLKESSSEIMEAIIQNGAPCTKKVLHAVASAKMMFETGVLDPDGHACNVLYEVMAFITQHPEIKEIAANCEGCD